MHDDHSDDAGRSETAEEQEADLQTLVLEGIADPVCTFTQDGRFSYVNAAFESETGHDLTEIRGQPLTVVMRNDDAQTLLRAIERIREDVETDRENVDVTLEGDNTESIPVECSLSLLESGARETTDAVVVMRDITERKERERRLSKFASVVSHDLRNPLDVALGRAEMLPKIADVDSETEQHLNEIHNSLTRMEHLIEDVLTLSQQENDVIETGAVNLAAVTTEAWRTVETNDATLTVTTDIAVSAHRDRLRRLLENLFRNAIEHGGPSVAVEVGQLTGGETNGVVGFYVADDGPGIDDQDRSRLFEGGYTTSNEGTGLGLTIVREIANAHGWSVAAGTVDDDTHLDGAQFDITGVSTVTE